MNKYITFLWVLEGAGWKVSDTLEEAKNEWCFGMMVFETTKDDAESFMNYAKEIESNRLVLEKIKEKYDPVYQDGEPYEWLITK